MAFLGPMPIYWPFMDRQPIGIFSKFWNLVFCFIIKNIMYSCLTFFSKTSKISTYELKFLNCNNFNIFLWFLINLINDDTFVSVATADARLMVHLVFLFIKTHLLALLQDNFIDLVRSASLRKEHNSVLSTPTEADIGGLYRPGRYIGLSILHTFF